MKHTTKLTLLLAATALAGFASQASAQERGTLSSRVGIQRGVIFTGEPTRQPVWRRQVTTRAVNDSFVYRKEGKATTRHDEESSPEVIFHVVKGQRVKAGHVYQRRAR